MDNSSEAPWQPTHAVPAGGLPAWNAPDPAAPPVTQVAERLLVRVLESNGAWARVVFENGWSGWLDGRRLTPLAAQPTPPLPGQPTPPPPEDAVSAAMRQAVEACRKLLDDFEQRRIDEQALRAGLLDAAVIRLPGCLVLLDMEQGRWARFDGSRLDVFEMNQGR